MTRTNPPTPTPPVDGAALLDRLRDVISRYVILPTSHAADAVTLWIAATHAQDAWAHAPRLVIRAPEKRCGKSRLLDVVEAVCCCPLITVNASPAAVYRAIGSDTPPTLLVDEADTIFGPNAPANEDLRGLLNAGHQRNRPALRYDANTQRVEKIPTFAMAALAGIGAMPDTIEDRAVVIKMRRRAPGETVAPYRHRRDRPGLVELSALINAWLHDHLKELERAEPVMPLEDRAADTWEPLIAVADLAGGDWPARAREAAVTLTNAREETAVASERIRLLTDCRTAFGDADALPTSALIERLKADPEAPWSDLTPMRFAALLREYDITSTNIRFPAPIGQVKGYYRDGFTDAWARYCTADPAETDLGSPAPSGRPGDGRRRLVAVPHLLTPGRPSQPSHPSQRSSTLGRDLERDDLSRPSQDLVPSATRAGTTGTAGTATPLLSVADGTT